MIILLQNEMQSVFTNTVTVDTHYFAKALASLLQMLATIFLAYAHIEIVVASVAVNISMFVGQNCLGW